MKRVLITGASGFLGTKLYDMFALNADVLGTFHTHPRPGLVHLDVTDYREVTKVICSFNPDVVIHTVAMSNPDLCEQRQAEADVINCIGTEHVVEASRAVGARVDYISTVYVFDGQKGNYRESDIPNPINYYGSTKFMAEQIVATLSTFGIYRFDKLYGINGANKPNEVFSKFELGKTLEVNNDQIRQPILIDDVVRSIRHVQDLGMNGIFHLSGQDRMSKYDLCRALAHLVGKEDLVAGIPEKEQFARRPRDASLVTTKIETLGMRFTPLQTALSLIKTELQNSQIEGRRKHIER